MFEVNVFGLCRMIRTVLTGMPKRRKKFIVNLTSIAAPRRTAFRVYRMGNGIAWSRFP